MHFAAASGNLGLVEFALSHGQPINSVLNGVLPLHAACAGGSEVVVKYLIDEGADVNAPRSVLELLLLLLWPWSYCGRIGTADISDKHALSHMRIHGTSSAVSLII